MFSRFQDYRVLERIAKCYRVLQSITEYYRVLQSVTECYRVLESVTECYRVLQSDSPTATVEERPRSATIRSPPVAAKSPRGRDPRASDSDGSLGILLAILKVWWQIWHFDGNIGFLWHSDGNINFLMATLTLGWMLFKNVEFYYW